MNLSKNFSLSELTFSETAARLGVDNTPTEAVIHNLKKLCERILQPARDALGPLRISSGYRSPELNAKVPGSSNTSAHTLGFAADVLSLKVSKLEFARWVAKNCEFDQIILEYGTKADPAWIHVSADPKNRKQIMRIMTGTGYVPVKLEDI